MMSRQAAQQDKRQDNGGKPVLIPFPSQPDAASDAPGPDLGPVVAARIEHWCRAYDLPLSTLRTLRAAGKGPPTFEIGRLLYCRREDWCRWLEGLATAGGTGPLTPPAGRLGRRTTRGTRANTGNP
jgi:hypothetical protein